MKNVPRRLLRLLTAASILSISAGLAIAAEEPLVFTFNPPENATCVMAVKTTKVTTTSEGKRTEVATSRERLTFAKTTDGYTVTATPISADITRDGQPADKVTAAMAHLMTSVPLVYQLDNKGKCLSISGQEAITKKVTESLGKDAPPALLKALPTLLETAVAKEITEWNGRIADFVGMNAKVGDVLKTTTIADTPGGDISMPTKTKFLGRADAGGKNCVRIGLEYAANSSTVKDVMQGAVNRMASLIGESAYTVVDAKMVGEGVRMVDPTTMLIYSENVSRTINLVVKAAGEEKSNVSILQKREYQYDYSR